MPQPDIGLCYNCSHGWIPKGKKSKDCPRCRSTRIIFIKPKDILKLIEPRADDSQVTSRCEEKVSDFM